MSEDFRLARVLNKKERGEGVFIFENNILFGRSNPRFLE